MSNSVPVVLTPLIAAPIPELQDGQNCFISKDADEFASRCVTLMTDKQKRIQMGRHGREMVKQNYAWGMKLRGYEIFNSSHTHRP
jgi:glycosyltransferase involved in cell wall biosynthesis